jgi:hypothetical protein|tara:strand:+ start:84 stop:350 length:267 start_codon:yes stop_codon:yes gene_type:complete
MKKAIIIGAGSASLSAATELSKKNQNFKILVIENSKFYPIGKTGMFKYNNQDHAILTGLIGVRKICENSILDPWPINIDAEYHEEKNE